MRFLTTEEKKILQTLTHPPTMCSVFRKWLNRLDFPGSIPDYYKAALLEIDGVIRGWAAACLPRPSLYDSSGEIGVFIHPEFRGRGLARKTLDFLIANLAAIRTQDFPEYLVYDKGKERLFRELILKHGFKDIYIRDGRRI